MFRGCEGSKKKGAFGGAPLGKMKNLKALLDDVFPDVGFAIGERKLEGVGADVG